LATSQGRPQRSEIPNDQDVRERYSALGSLKKYPDHLDYASSERFELLKYFYRKRLDLYIDTLRKQVINNSTEIPFDEVLDPGYTKICEDWILAGGYPDKDVYPESVIKTVAAAFENTKLEEDALLWDRNDEDPNIIHVNGRFRSRQGYWNYYMEEPYP